MRIRPIAASLVSGFVAAVAIAGSAQAQEFSADFTTDDDGFDLFEVNSDGTFSSGPLSHVMSGGNPGGFIRWEDLNSGAEEKLAWFVPSPSDVPVDSDLIGMVMSFDIRSTGATPARPVFIEVGDRQNPAAEGRIRCEFGVPSASWTTYSVVISPDDPCWRDFGGEDADASDFGGVFTVPELISAWVVSADFSPQAGELSDLDNFVLEEWVLGREITLKYKKRSRAFGGVVSQVDGAFPDVCVDTVVVQLFREAGAEDKLLDTDLTKENGKFKFAKNAKKNKQYYAVAPKIGEAPACAAATSKTIRPL
jgi:hypothetical protein